jgi:hypothetical protein
VGRGRCGHMPAAKAVFLKDGNTSPVSFSRLSHADNSLGSGHPSQLLIMQMWMWARPLPPGDRPCPGVRRVLLSEDAVCISFGALRGSPALPLVSVAYLSCVMD